MHGRWFILVYILLNKVAKCVQQECNQYFDGFNLEDTYNRHVPPGDTLTIFDVQHVKDIVEVSHSIVCSTTAKNYAVF